MSDYYPIAVDIECTDEGLDRSPDAIYPNNRILTVGWAHHLRTCGTSSGVLQDFIDELKSIFSQGMKPLLIGQNIKFDLKYLMRDEPDFEWEECDVWDTQYFDYRYTGQIDKNRSLETLCDSWGIRYKKHIDLGTWLKTNRMIDIPMADLLKYVREDASVTYALYLEQLRVKKEYFMGHIMPIAAMELRGMKVDLEYLRTLGASQLTTVHNESGKIWHQCASRLHWEHGLKLEEKHLKHTSARTLSYLLTGEPATGLGKRAKGSLVLNRKPLLNQNIIDHVWHNESPSNLGYSMDEGHLTKLTNVLSKAPSRTRAHDLVDSVVAHRKANKMYNTYISFMLAQANETGGTVHPNINLTVTATGRTSSSKPNGQNMPPEIRKAITSEHGFVVEIDFKQLEVVAAACLSGDPQLLDDLIHGRDVHYQIGKTVMGWTSPKDMTEQTRRSVKAVTFGILYGAGTYGIADSSGLAYPHAKRLIEAFYDRYPGIKQWHEEMVNIVRSSPTAHTYRQGEVTYRSDYECPIGDRHWTYVEKEAPQWRRAKTGRKYDFKVTEIKNYPVQGFAGGDLVMVCLALMDWAFRDLSKTDLRVTVHDSILIDTDQEIVVIKDRMDKVINLLTGWFNLPVTLQYDVKGAGTHWS